MFLLPWRVDVPQDRWPVMNWLILAALVVAFFLQIADIVAYRMQQEAHGQTTQGTPGANSPARSSAAAPPPRQEIPGITGRLMLRGWSLKGLFGYMWLHGGLFHLLGNMLFLWIFGNAVCAKIGNVRYLLLYVVLGVTAGIAHLLVARGAVVGASGAINGVVGMYLMFFYQNEITCLFAFWFILPYVRVFTVSSIWIILIWVCWDVVGALLPGGSNVAYFAHLGGFGAGFAVAFLMCKKGWVTMERYERSLLQAWEERAHDRRKETQDTTYAQLGLLPTDEERQSEGSLPALSSDPEPIPLPPLEPGPALGIPLSRAAPSEKSIERLTVPGNSSFIRTACACGHAIRVTQQYAGRTVRCPNCRQRLVIPHRTDFFGPAAQPAHGSAILKRAQDNVIRFLCTCGRRIRVPARYAGHTCRCPQCNTTLRIPALPPGGNPISD